MWTIGKVIHDRGDWLDEAQSIREFFHTLPRQGLQILARDWREKGYTGPLWHVVQKKRASAFPGRVDFY